MGPPQPPHHRPPSLVSQRIDQWLASPLVQLDQLRRVSLTLTLFMIVAVLAGIAIDIKSLGSAAWHDPDFYTVLLVLPLLLIFLYLHRVHYQRLVTAGLLVVLTSSIVVMAIPDKSPADAYLLLYLLLPVMMSSALFSVRLTGALMVINTLAVSAFAMLFEDTVFDISWSFYMLVISLSVLLVTRLTAQLQRQRQQALNAYEARSNALLKAFPDLIFQLDRDCRIVDYRTADVRLLHRPPEEFLGRIVDDVLPPPVATQTHHLADAAFKTGQIHRGEYTLPLPSGGTGFYEQRLLPLDGQHVLSVVRDISEQRQTEAALHTSERLVHDTFEAIPDPAILWERQPDGRVILKQFNQAALAESRGRMPEFAGATAQGFFDDRPDIAAHILEAMDSGSVRREEVRFRMRTTSTEKWALADYVRVGENQVLHIIRDISDLKETEETLRRSEARYRTLLTALPDMILRVSRDGTILDFENAWSGMVMPPGGLVGRSPAEFIPNEVERALAVLGRAFDTQAVQKTEVKVPIDGEIRIFEARVTPSTDSEAVVIVRDVTELNRTQQAELEQRTLAEALSRTAAALNETLEPDLVLERILDGITSVIPFDAASVLLIDGSEVRVAACRGYEGWTDIKDMRFPLSVFYLQVDLITKGQVLVIPDTVADHRWAHVPATSWIAAHISAPIKAGDQVLGFLNVDSATRNVYTVPHGGQLTAFADQMAIALRNAQLFSAARRHVAELEALRRVTLNITARLDLETLLDELTHSALAMLNVTEGGVYLYDAERDVLEWRVSVGTNTSAPGTFLRRGEGLSGRVWEHGRTIVIDDYSTWAGRASIYDEFTWYSVIGVPIQWQGELLGVFNVVSSTPDRRFSVNDIQLLELLVNQAAIAVQNARLFAAERAQREFLEALRDSMAVVNSTLDPKEVLRHILQHATRVVQHDSAHIMLFEGDLGMVAGSQGYEQFNAQGPISQFQLTVQDFPTVTSMFESGQGYIVDDTTADPRWVRVPGFEWVRSHLSAPIRLNERVIGALNLDGSQPGTFRPADLERIQVFADQAAMAIENARLYAETRLYTDILEQRVGERTVDLSVRNAVAETLSRSLEMTGMLDAVLSIIVEKLGVRGGVIDLLLPDNSLDLAACCGVPPDVLMHVRPPAPPEAPVVHEVVCSSPTAHPCSALSVPIWQQDRAVGSITLLRDDRHDWRGEEQRMMDAIGRQIGVALANVRLYAHVVRDEAQLRAILRHVADGLLVFDQHNRLILMNRAAEELFAFFPANEGGPAQAADALWSWLCSQPPAQQDGRIEFSLPESVVTGDMSRGWAAQCGVEDCPSAGENFSLWPCWLSMNSRDEVHKRRCPAYQALARRAIQARRAEIADADGPPQGSVIALHDVTYFRELDDLKGRFVSNVSHELRTPLSAMLLQVSTLLRYYDHFSDSERRTQIHELQQQAHVLRELIEDILELSRFDARRSVPQKRWFDLVDQCREVIATLEPALGEKHLTLTREDCPPSCFIFADPHQIMRVLRNLIGNAIKFTPEGGTITLEMAQAADEIRFAVIDTGIGISAEDQARIFERFFRTDNAAQMAAGSGLGLSISREIVSLHGGHIQVQSALNHGSRFTVYLPVVSAEDAGTPGSPAADASFPPGSSRPA